MERLLDNQTYTFFENNVVVQRVTNRGDASQNRNDYSRRNPENHSGNYFLSYKREDYPWRVNTLTWQVKSIPLHPDAEPIWGVHNPYDIYHLRGPNSYPNSGGMSLLKTNFSSGSFSEVFNLSGVFGQVDKRSGRTPFITTKSEGSCSADQLVWGFMVIDETEQNIVGFVTCDINGNIISQAQNTKWSPPWKLNSVSVTPSGQYFVYSANDGVFVAPVNDLGTLTKVFPKTEHSDICLGEDGHDYLVQPVHADNGWVQSYCIQDPSRSRKFFSLYSYNNPGIHFCGKAYSRPGWMLFNTHREGVNDPVGLHKQVGCINVHTGEVKIIIPDTWNNGCYAVNKQSPYFTETHAACNKDMTNIYYNTNFDTLTDQVEVLRATVDIDSLSSFIPGDNTDTPTIPPPVVEETTPSVEPTPTPEPVNPTGVVDDVLEKIEVLEDKIDTITSLCETLQERLDSIFH